MLATAGARVPGVGDDTPRSVAASRSRLVSRMPTMVISFRFGSRSISVRGKAMRSRMVQITSNGASARAASSSVRCASKTVISALPSSRDQSALRMATWA